MLLELRRATPADARFVWEVNNHPAVRAQSLSTADISWEDHQQWFGRKLADSRCLQLIAWVDQSPVAVVRFDVVDHEATISVAVSPSAHGRGIGGQVIALGTAELARAVPLVRAVAWIRSNNVASLKAFGRAGYRRVGAEMKGGVALDRFEYPSPSTSEQSPV